VVLPSLVTQARWELSIPVIASLNGVSRGGWSAYATLLEAARVHALELTSTACPRGPGCRVRSQSSSRLHIGP
jgi:dihydroorotate dehydrogenase (fumarate)